MIEVENLTKYYKDFKALDNITFSVKKGEIAGFLGPNGAGKTTTMRVITGFSDFQSGQVLVNGECVKNNPLAVKGAIGYLPENLFFYEELSIYEYLKYTAGLKNIATPVEKIQIIMEQTEISGEKNQLIQTLSRGYRQRLGLATALLSNPPVLILDEPTNGLDPIQIMGIRKLIKELGKEKTILISTHILSEVEAICDKVILINEGKVKINQSLEGLKNIRRETVVPFRIKVEKQEEAQRIVSSRNYVISYHQNREIMDIILKNMDFRKNLIQDLIPAGILEFTVQESPLESLFQNLENMKGSML